MNRVIVTRWRDQSLTAIQTDGVFRSLILEPDEGPGGISLGDIRIGKVKNVVKNINAAFVDLGNGATGYLSLSEPAAPLFTDSLSRYASAQAFSLAEPLHRIRQGDEILVQVEKEAIKTKDPVVTSCLNFPGRLSVLTVGRPGLGFSAKIRDEEWKRKSRERLQPFLDGRFGLIIRTNAPEAGEKALLAEVQELMEQAENLLAQAACRTCYSLLQAGSPPFIQALRDARTGSLGEVVTDIPEYRKAIEDFLITRGEESTNLTFYEDPSLPLMKLTRLEAAMKSACERRVWLKSGGYLVIEPTEALTVIDVNTGKYTGKKTAAETIRSINLEAAAETARQLSLRNLSGIIIVDFIDMEKKEDQEQLMAFLGEELKKDPVKTVLVDMTKLGLVEITRKKVRRPLHESLNRSPQGNGGDKNDR